MSLVSVPARASHPSLSPYFVQHSHASCHTISGKTHSHTELRKITSACKKIPNEIYLSHQVARKKSEGAHAPRVELDDSDPRQELREQLDATVSELEGGLAEATLDARQLGLCRQRRTKRYGVT